MTISLGKPVPVTNHPLSEEPPVWSSPGAALFHFHVSCCWSLERADQLLPLYFLEEVVNCDGITPSLLFSELSKPSDLRCSSQVLPSRPFTTFAALLGTQYNRWMYFFWGPQNCAQYWRWDCSVEHDYNLPQPTSHAVSHAPQDTVGPSGYQGTAYSICQGPSSPDLILQGCFPDSLPLIWMYNHIHPSPVENPALALVTETADFCGELLPVGWTHNGEVHRELSPLGGTPHWSRGRTHLSEQWQKRPRINWS